MLGSNSPQKTEYKTYIEVSDFMKFQAPNPKYQINLNDPNSKFQTQYPPKFTLFIIFNGSTSLQCDGICNLVLEIWDFDAFQDLLMQIKSKLSGEAPKRCSL